MFTDALIDAFVMSAKDDDVLLHRELVAQRLVEEFTVRAHINDFVVVALAFQVVDAVVDRLDHHHHACTGGKRVVVHLVVLVSAVVAEVVQTNLHNALIYSTFDDGLGEGHFLPQLSFSPLVFSLSSCL